MTAMCKTRVPAEISAAVDARADDDAELKSYGVDLGVAMSHQLLAYGAPGLHFYTLNLEKSTLAIAERVATARAKKNRAKVDLLKLAVAAAGLALVVGFALKRRA